MDRWNISSEVEAIELEEEDEEEEKEEEEEEKKKKWIDLEEVD